jgi:formylmethanofuran dehydrogenase subunit E
MQTLSAEYIAQLKAERAQAQARRQAEDAEIQRQRESVKFTPMLHTAKYRSYVCAGCGESIRIGDRYHLSQFQKWNPRNTDGGHYESRPVCEKCCGGK